MTEEEKTEEIEFKPRLKSKFSMGELDFMRFDGILRAIDKFAFYGRQGSEEAIMPWWSALYGLYVNFRPILYETVKKQMDDDFKKLRTLIHNDNLRVSSQKILVAGWTYDWKNNPACHLSQGLIQGLDELQIQLMEIKQICGLGLTVKKEHSDNKLVKETLE